MSSSFRKCPVCEQELTGEAADIDRHVNKHLDESEEEQSRKVAEELHHQHDQHASGNGQPSTASEVLSPAERMMRELEDGDAALASQIAAADGSNGTNPHFISASLRGSLTDSAEYFYPNILTKIFPHYDSMESALRKKVHICSKLDLFSSNVAGLGWDCGFRNIQMLFSSLLYDADSARLLQAAGMAEVPSVPEIAGRIEDAWKKGFDPEGAANFGGTLLDKEVWIGATEVFILLRSMKVNAFVKDFETPTDEDKGRMFAWIFNHFNQWCNGRSCSVHRRSLLGSRRHFLVPPIFCQWQGHSVTIVGAEKTKTGDILVIVLDPSRGFFHSLMEHRTSRMSLVRRGIEHPQFAQPRFQLVSLPPSKSSGGTSIRQARRGLLGGLRLGGPS